MDGNKWIYEIEAGVFCPECKGGFRCMSDIKNHPELIEGFVHLPGEYAKCLRCGIIVRITQEVVGKVNNG